MGRQGTLKEWRRDLLEQLRMFQRADIKNVEWITAGDEHVCSLCRSRANTI